MKHSAKRSIIPMASSVAPNSNAPASDVIAPPSNPATTLRPSTDANSNSSGLHSVAIGALLESPESLCCTNTFADSAPRCASMSEISGLEPLFHVIDADRLWAAKWLATARIPSRQAEGPYSGPGGAPRRPHGALAGHPAGDERNAGAGLMDFPEL